MVPGRQQQRGIAILTIVILIALAAITYFLTLISPDELKIDRQEQTLAELKHAKQALIAHAITHADQPGDAGEFGNLPCPDIDGSNGEGKPRISCNLQKSNSIGYFPWAGLGLNIDALRDSAGNCLLYVVSPEYKTAPVGEMLNEDTNGLIQIVDATGNVIEGASADTRPVAVVIAAGQALVGQNRTPDGNTICGMDYNNRGAYLDNDGTTDNANPTIAADTISKFVNASTGSDNTANPLNDQLVTISREEIWKAILNRDDFKTKMDHLAQALALCLADYANSNPDRRLPWPASVNFSGGDYRTNANYQDVAGGLYAGRLPYDVSNSSAITGSVATILFDTAGCENLAVGGGVDLKDLNSEYGKLWRNWKDHFFYAISKVYEPVTGSPGEAECNVVTNDCITVAGAPYAGIVFYSGSRLNGQSRDAPPPLGDSDDKAVISNYLENGNEAIFTGATGTQADTYNTNGPNPATENDVMWCINHKAAGVGAALDVVVC